MKYRNLEPPYLPSSFGDFLKWAVTDRAWGRRRQAPRRVRFAPAEPDLALLASPAPSLTWVGHATWIVRLAGVTLYLDPNWSDSVGCVVPRNAPPGLPLDEAPPPDAVLITHNHRDHLDAATLSRLAGRHRDLLILCGEGLGPFFLKRGLRVVELPWWGEHEVPSRDGQSSVRVAFVPSQHWSQRGLFDRNDSLWGGYVVSGGGLRVYHAGDTAYFGGFRDIGRRYPGIDAALLPIGAYDPEWFMRRQHMDPEDALRAFRDLDARLLGAMHFGTFKLTDEPLDEPPRLLRELAQQSGVPPEQLWIPRSGESRRIG